MHGEPLESRRLLAGDVIGQAGSASAVQDNADQWHRVDFNQTLDDPIVVAGPLSRAGGDPSVVRVRDVTSDGFEWQIDEWDYLNGRHARESFDWLAIERGTHTLPGGRQITAAATAADHVFSSVAIDDIGTDPVVFAQAVTDANADALTVRLRNVDDDAFDVRIQREQAGDPTLAEETVHYIAMSRGVADGWQVQTTGDQFSHRNRTITVDGSVDDDFAFLATMQTTDGADPSSVRQRSRDVRDVTVYLEEERSLDDEMRHTKEVLAYAALPAGIVRADETQTTFGNGGDPWAVFDTGSTRIQAEYFDVGGQDNSYNETSSGNSAGDDLRPDAPDVDVSSRGIGYFAGGEWLEYTIDVRTAGEYQLAVRAAAPNGGSGFNVSLGDGPSLTGDLTVGPTDGWSDYTTRTARINLDAGRQVLRFTRTNAVAMNFDWIEIRSDAEEPDEANLLGNGRFITDLSGWSQFNSGGLSATQTLDPDHVTPGFIGGSLRVEFQGAAGPNWWNAGARTGVTLRPGREYRLNFAADADADRPLHIQIQQGSTYYRDVDLQLRSGGTGHSFTFRTGASVADGEANVVFYYGNSDVGFWLDVVRLVDVGPASPNVSSEAIVVGFENQTVGSAYDRTAQQADWDIEFVGDDMATQTTIVDSHAGGGDRSLRVAYPPDRQVLVQSSWELPSRDEYYLQYKVRFDEDFVFNGSTSAGGKLPGLGGGGRCSGGRVCDGTNGFTTRYMWREDGRAILYLYDMDKPVDADGNSFGRQVALTDPDTGRDVYFPRGRWITITQRVRINTADNADGEVDVWIDGDQVLDLRGVRFVTNGDGVDKLYFSTFHGGSTTGWWPDREVYAHFDDFLVTPNASDVVV